MAEDWNFWKLGLLGIVAGLIAGLVMWAFMTIITLIGGQGFWAMPKWVADAVYGDSWLGFNGTDVVTGLVIHFIVSLLLGAIFAVIAVPFITGSRQLLLSGVLWGLVVWVLLSVLAMNAVDETMAQEVPHVPWLIANLLFGIVVAIVLNPIRALAMRGGT